MKEKIGVSLIWCNKSWRNINLADAKIWRILLRQIMLTRVYIDIIVVLLKSGGAILQVVVSFNNPPA